MAPTYERPSLYSLITVGRSLLVGQSAQKKEYKKYPDLAKALNEVLGLGLSWEFLVPCPVMRMRMSAPRQDKEFSEPSLALLAAQVQAKA